MIDGLAEHYSRFRVGERLLLTGHSHQAWPDIAREGVLAAWDDAALLADEKWGRAFEQAERVRDAFRALLGDPRAEIALGQNTHELVLRFLSALELARRPRIVTTDGEFHTLRRQVARLAEEPWAEVVVVPARPAETLAERLAGEVGARTAAVLVSAVLFEDARIVPGLDELAHVCATSGTELLVDVYHALGALPFELAEQGLESAWVVGGGYKYLQLGEGNCFLRVPPQADSLRPVLTGWFAEFADLSKAPRGEVAYPTGGARYAGSTYDPTSHYRAARVFEFFREQGLTPQRLRESYLHQTSLLARLVDELALDDEVATRDRETPLERFGGFITLESPRADELQARLAEAGVLTDSRGRYLRLGPAPYLSDEQLETAVERLGHAAGARHP